MHWFLGKSQHTPETGTTITIPVVHMEKLRWIFQSHLHRGYIRTWCLSLKFVLLTTCYFVSQPKLDRWFVSGYIDRYIKVYLCIYIHLCLPISVSICLSIYLNLEFNTVLPFSFFWIIWPAHCNWSNSALNSLLTLVFIFVAAPVTIAIGIKPKE